MVHDVQRFFVNLVLRNSGFITFYKYIKQYTSHVFSVGNIRSEQTTNQSTILICTAKGSTEPNVCGSVHLNSNFTKKLMKTKT